MQKKPQASAKKIAQVLLKPKGNHAMCSLLEDLLTPAELLTVNERISIIEALSKGVAQREISKKLGVSISKVTRGSRVLQYGTGGLVKALR